MKKILVLLVALSLTFLSCNKIQNNGVESTSGVSTNSSTNSSSTDSSSTDSSSTDSSSTDSSSTDSSSTDSSSTDSSSIDSSPADSSSTDSSDSNVVGAQPTLTDEGSILYGLYPQTRVREESVQATLDSLSPSELNGWCLYNNEYYAKAVANVYNSESYTFDDGEAIVDGREYWFKCEPIEWQILQDGEGEYYLLSSALLDSQAYYSSYESRSIGGQTIYANNYAESDIRAWLNDEFFSVAFALDSTFVLEKSIDNGGGTSEFLSNPYASANTSDKVFLPSYQDYLNGDYGFVSEAGKTALREAKTTDYARATGAWCHTRNNSNAATKANGSYWTRSPSGEYDYCASVVNSGGVMSTYVVDERSHCVRPALYINKVREAK